MEFLNKYKIDQVYISNQINNKSKYLHKFLIELPIYTCLISYLFKILFIYKQIKIL